MSRLQTLTSYDAATLGNVVNQVQWSYNGYGFVSQTHTTRTDRDPAGSNLDDRKWVKSE